MTTNDEDDDGDEDDDDCVDAADGDYKNSNTDDEGEEYENADKEIPCYS